MPTRTDPWLALLALALTASLESPSVRGAEPACPADMVVIEARFCVDRFEASLERLDDRGQVTGAHPANQSPGTQRVRARSLRGVLPQAHISQEQAARACQEAGKRLCSRDEWRTACRGAPATRFPYGERKRRGACNDEAREPLAEVAPKAGPSSPWGVDVMNDPRLHLVAGAAARTGRFDRCQSEAGVLDMVGNLHEWTSEPEGTMRGGFYLDASSLGQGCDYAATGHDTRYHDYSTGFRCCRDARQTGANGVF